MLEMKSIFNLEQSSVLKRFIKENPRSQSEVDVGSTLMIASMLLKEEQVPKPLNLTRKVPFEVTL